MKEESKIPLGRFWAKVGGAVGLIGPEMYVFQHISNLVHQILMKLSGNVPGIKRIKTDEHARARMSEHVTKLVSMHSL